MNKVIVITGAANGVGRATVELLKDNQLILIDEDEVNLKEVASSTNSKYFVCDVSKESEVEDVAKRIIKENNHIDCLINCAGMWISGEISKLGKPVFENMNSLSRIKKVIDTNVFGTIAMIKSIFPVMKQQGYGQIININSQSGVTCEPLFPIYNATKQSTNAFRKAIQNDLAKSNIKITDICPGLIQTGFYKRAGNVLPQEIMNTGLTACDVANTVKYIIDLPKGITIPCIEIKNIKNN